MDFWDSRYRSGSMPWDQGGAPPRLVRFLGEEPGAGRRVLIPGCGSGYELAAFAASGWEVTAIDFSEAAVARARANAGPSAGRILCGDFFAYPLPAGGFDLVYERTFLCALPRRLWPAYVPRVAGLLAPEGRLAGFFFFDSNPSGPPFGLVPGELEGLLGPRFTLQADEPVPATESVTVLAGRERWQVWKLM